MEVPEDRPISGQVALRTGVPVYRRDFVEQICGHLADYALGKCLTPEGEMLNEYVTLYLRHCVTMRGDRQTVYKPCRSCGSVWSDLVMVFPGRPAYLLRHQLTGGLVYQARSSFLFLAEELVDRIDWSPFPDARLDAVEVRDTPLDGRRLPGDPDWEATK
jgi:hypothetical protein